MNVSPLLFLILAPLLAILFIILLKASRASPRCAPPRSTSCCRSA